MRPDTHTHRVLELAGQKGLLRGDRGSTTGAGMVRVRPFQPAESWPWLKLNCQQPGLGVRMPFNGPPYLSPTLRALILDWILLGAPLFPVEDRILLAGFEQRF